MKEEIKIIGKGKLGKSINKITKWEFIDRNNLQEINNLIVINCTPASALPKISKYKPKYIINCCKGMYKGKTASDYFKKNITSIGGFYKHQNIKNKLTVYISKTPIKIKKELEKVFNLKEVISTSKQIEMSGVIKNLLLIYHTKFCVESFLDDFQECINYGSRNEKFSKMFFKYNYPLKYIKEKLGTIEGLTIAPQLLKKRFIKW
ncbi:MAG: hypothetical protein ACP6IY_09455 [Promethearchaeia archaeon]